MILVTGGTGYIGSHTVVELLARGFDVLVIDNLVNSKASVIDRIERITGRRPVFHRCDVRDRTALRSLFGSYRIDAVMHFAGLKAVGESALHPLKYYDCNVSGSIVLFECMMRAGVRKIVFSSSATVYGAASSVCYREDFPLAPVNPYGRTKLVIENILRDAAADRSLQVALLRYFNPVGAHPSGYIGEDPRGIPNNLMPYIAQVASGRLDELPVYGDDYPTVDGTGVRDYIHVVDLARGHLAAMNKLRSAPGVLTLNLGTGRGYSVLQMLRCFAEVSNRPVPYRIVARRPGDLAEYFADPSLAGQLLGWQAQLGISEMCADVWRWRRWAADNLQDAGGAGAAAGAAP